MRVCATNINAGRRQTFRPEPFPNEQNYAEWFLDDPVLKIEHAQSGKNKKTEKREQLIAPFHEAM